MTTDEERRHKARVEAIALTIFVTAMLTCTAFIALGVVALAQIVF